MGKIKHLLIILMLSILSAWGVETTTVNEEDEKQMDDNEHMFI
tara:strand:+ start:305 stop:433 length:129 start_codon:yes stop_codon:yes gene_type:complete